MACSTRRHHSRSRTYWSDCPPVRLGLMTSSCAPWLSASKVEQRLRTKCCVSYPNRESCRAGRAPRRRSFKYLPERASRPEAWDLLSDEDAICTTCSWGPPPMGSAAQLQQEMRRHTDRVHGGRSE